MLRPTASRPVCLGIITHLRLMTRYLLLFDNYVSVFVGRPLWREDRSVFCICYWSSPVQSFFGPRPFILEIIFYCLRFETSLFVVSYDSQGHGGADLFWPGTSLLLRETLADWIQNTYFDTTASSVFVTAETIVKVFIPVVTVYYLRVAAWTRLIVWAVV
jgi:hypothetical protein